ITKHKHQLNRNINSQNLHVVQHMLFNAFFKFLVCGRLKSGHFILNQTPARHELGLFTWVQELGSRSALLILEKYLLIM
ncbi:hypothetical protein, partial [Salmonella sp. s51933]|uniref:hypothetical protein n=1 Tax=Salmonella sp. s51933 TaxID=3160127 RepID=UPI00375406C3